MSTPEFITNLRAKIGNDPLWLTGITASWRTLKAASC